MKKKIGYAVITGMILTLGIYCMSLLSEHEPANWGILILLVVVSFMGISMGQLMEYVVADPVAIRKRALKDMRVALDRLREIDKSRPDYEEWRAIYEARVLVAIRDIREHLPATIAAKNQLLDRLLPICGHQSMHAMPTADNAFRDVAASLGAEVVDKEEAVS